MDAFSALSQSSKVLLVASALFLLSLTISLFAFGDSFLAEHGQADLMYLEHIEEIKAAVEHEAIVGNSVGH